MKHKKINSKNNGIMINHNDLLKYYLTMSRNIEDIRMHDFNGSISFKDLRLLSLSFPRKTGKTKSIIDFALKHTPLINLTIITTRYYVYDNLINIEKPPFCKFDLYKVRDVDCLRGIRIDSDLILYSGTNSLDLDMMSKCIINNNNSIYIELLND